MFSRRFPDQIWMYGLDFETGENGAEGEPCNTVLRTAPVYS